MKTETENERSMDELVFENRNKDYGAYVLRKEYNDHMQQAFNMVCVGGAGIVILLSVLSERPIIKIPDLPKGPVVELKNEPDIIVPTKPAAQLPKGINKDLAPKVTTAIPLTEEIPVEEPTAGVENGTNTGEVTTSTAIVGTGPVEVPTVEVVEPPKIVDWAEVMPQYKGGAEAMMKYMQKKVRYPALARRVNTQGTVFVSFIIDTQGKVIATKVLKGISKECDEEAARVISSMPDWNAGRMGNLPVMVRMVLPIKFVLNN